MLKAVISKYLTSLEKLYSKKIDASGLGIFRITYSLVLLCEVGQLYYFRHLIFDEIPFISPGEINLAPALIVWMLCLFFLLFGLFTRWIAVINYILSLVFISTINSYEYHMFYIYMGVNFLLIFIDTAKVNSIDRLLLKFKYSNTRFNYYPERTTSVLNYHLLVLISIAFVYFDSVFFKFSSKIWLNGLGMWLPASYPNLVHANTSLILDLKWLVISLGYLTLLFEAIFLFTFFRKKWRVPLLIVGIGLHIGILIEFPIPWFALGVISCYLLMVPVGYWTLIRNKLSFPKPQLIFFYDEECPLCNRTRIALKHFDYLNAIEFKGVQTYGFDHPQLSHISKDELLDNIYSITKNGKVLNGIQTYIYAFKKIPSLLLPGLIMSTPGIYHVAKWVYSKIAANRYVERCNEENCGYIPPSLPINTDSIKLSKTLKVKDLKISFISVGVLLLILFQTLVTYDSPVASSVRDKIGLGGTLIDRKVLSLSRTVEKTSKILFGITHHAVFMDFHFEGYNHIIGVEVLKPDNTKEWLPLLNRNGMVGAYISGPTWAKWTFRTCSPQMDNEILRKGLRDFTTFWAFKNDLDYEKLKFTIYLKKMDSTGKWENAFLNKQLEKPWMQAGTAYWSQGDFILKARDMETF